MHKTVCRTAIALAFLGSAGLALAADLNLTSAQKQTIFQSVMNEKGQPAPAGFQPKVGAEAPRSLTSHALPGNVAGQVPAAKDFEYAKLANNEVLLINPRDRHVAEIIMEPRTTGSTK
jgi:hypothetical protein